MVLNRALCSNGEVENGLVPYKSYWLSSAAVSLVSGEALRGHREVNAPAEVTSWTDTFSGATWSHGQASSDSLADHWSPYKHADQVQGLNIYLSLAHWARARH